MDKKIQKSKSIRIKLFISLCIVIVVTILFLVIINNLVLESFYIYNKKDSVKNIFEQINEKYNNLVSEEEIEDFIKYESSKNNLDILISNPKTNAIITNDKTRIESMERLKTIIEFNENGKWGETLYNAKDVIIKTAKDKLNNHNYIVLMAKLDNKNELYIRTPISAIRESLKISNNVLITVGSISIIISGIIASIVSKRFSNPILELNNIAKQMSKLDFSKKYIPSESDDEIDELGKSINMMSDKLEETINELRKNNDELERDIKEKSKIDEMRTQFISDVSHELKTPIAIIQGYAEGLVENVNNDDESRKYYAEVILDEADKMDKLVKQLLELMKLEYGKREFNNTKFDIVSLIKEVLRKCDVMIKEQNINTILKNDTPIYVYADDFYIEQVVTNYITNAIKYSEEVNGKREIIIEVIEELNGMARICVYNTGKNFSEEEMKKIWGRFYKLDTSRNRESGGTGIGLSLVKAVMNNYNNKYGVQNRVDGVEFYFELNMEEE
ncbi:MAG: HAMP domain-containing protein [Clostridia bacterium]|nr:HAMP domain-containing protein [Clostridia bacterium]